MLLKEKKAFTGVGMPAKKTLNRKEENQLLILFLQDGGENKWRHNTRPKY